MTDGLHWEEGENVERGGRNWEKKAFGNGRRVWEERSPTARPRKRGEGEGSLSKQDRKEILGVRSNKARRKAGRDVVRGGKGGNRSSGVA